MEKEEICAKNINDPRCQEYLKHKEQNQVMSLIDSMRTDFYGQVNGASKLLAKRPEEMTEEQMKKGLNFVATNSLHSKRDKVHDHMQQYFNLRFPGDYESGTFGTSYESKSIIPEPKKKARYRDVNGDYIDDGLSQIFIEAAKNNKDQDGIMKLQKAANSFYSKPKLKVDNIIGPESATAIFDLVHENGFKKFKDRIALV